jgi:hypothetical protein
MTRLLRSNGNTDSRPADHSIFNMSSISIRTRNTRKTGRAGTAETHPGVYGDLKSIEQRAESFSIEPFSKPDFSGLITELSKLSVDHGLSAPSTSQDGGSSSDEESSAAKSVLIGDLADETRGILFKKAKEALLELDLAVKTGTDDQATYEMAEYVARAIDPLLPNVNEQFFFEQMHVQINNQNDMYTAWCALCLSIVGVKLEYDEGEMREGMMDLWRRSNAFADQPALEKVVRNIFWILVETFPVAHGDWVPLLPQAKR